VFPQTYQFFKMQACQGEAGLHSWGPVINQWPVEIKPWLETCIPNPLQSAPRKENLQTVWQLVSSSRKIFWSLFLRYHKVLQHFIQMNWRQSLNLFITTLFIIANRWKQIQVQPFKGWIDTQNVVHICNGHCSALKRRKFCHLWQYG
jgi:hypothetical protein